MGESSLAEGGGLSEVDGGSPRYSLWELTRYALRLGTTGFGGPVALVGYMHRDLVERRRWISEAEYKEGLTLAQLMPGPLAAQLAIYLGYVHYGLIGATLVGVGFSLPSFVMVVGLGFAYVRFGGLSWMQAVFYGVGASVIAIISVAAFKLVRKTLGRNRLCWAIAAVTATTTIVSEDENIWLFLAGGFVTWLAWRRAAKRASVVGAKGLWFPIAANVHAIGLGSPPILLKIGFFFAKAGAFVFGSGLAIVPFLYGGVVKENQWLNDREFLDAVAVAMITPGPIVITVGFIGYLIMAREQGFWGGLAGAFVAAFATFLPCYLFTVIPAPYFKKHGKNPNIVSFVDGVTAAAIGAIVGSCVVLGRRTIFERGLLHPEWPKLILFLITLGLLSRFKRLQEPVVVIAAAIAGLVVYPMVH